MNDDASLFEGNTQTLERALKILRSFGGDAKPLSNAELVRRTGYSKASVSRITATLVSLGYLNHSADCVRYQIGIRSLRLGHLYLSNSPTRHVARPIMQAFADEHEISIALAIGDELDMLYVEYCKSKHIATLRLGVGSVLPMELTSIGRAYLWAQPHAVREKLLFDIIKKAGPNGPSVVSRIENAFHSIEHDGFCMAIGEYQRDAFGISVPVFFGNPPVAMALSYGGVSVAPNERHLRRVLAPALMQTAAALRQAFANVDSMLF
jgi:IclR family transcriptional regulator, positive regulator for flagellar biogenesis